MNKTFWVPFGIHSVILVGKEVGCLRVNLQKVSICGNAWRSVSLFALEPRGCGFESDCHTTDLVPLGKGTLHGFPHFIQVKKST